MPYLNDIGKEVAKPMWDNASMGSLPPYTCMQTRDKIHSYEITSR
jgi:hypothetical protein